MRTSLAVLTILLSGLVSAESAIAQQRPDFSGVWQRVGRGTPAQTQSEWYDGDLPFTKEGLALFMNNKPGKGPRKVAPATGNDPIGGANPYGLYRSLIYRQRPMEFVQTPKELVQLFEVSRIFRHIYTDGRPVPDDVPAGPFWYGYSVGRWEGDTLVVGTVSADERAWLDEWGTPFSAEAKFEERWKKTAPDKLELRITVTDPVMYKEPWTSIPVIYELQPEGEVQEMIFAPMDEQFFNENIRDPAGLPTGQ